MRRKWFHALMMFSQRPPSLAWTSPHVSPKYFVLYHFCERKLDRKRHRKDLDKGIKRHFNLLVLNLCPLDGSDAILLSNQDTLWMIFGVLLEVFSHSEANRYQRS
ncbi:hypothetical protein HNY73_012212 [Argiope bruennichi]|uniref:Uncharacterized protein n=1 Tax=Argiope bruennichi TaxID=94029 RepID=A0A8T0EZ03_ARGBR|nr:hypothetical protein HNY73_012212 [Argiope bruennichi]